MMHNASYNDNIIFEASGTTGCKSNWNDIFIKDINSMYTSSVLFCVINSFTGASAVFGNALVILAIVKTESLHSPSNIALCCLAVPDFITGLIAQPCVVISSALRITGHYSLYCAFHECFVFTGVIMTGASCLTIAVISMDRFLALHFHLRYPQIVTIPRILVAECIGLTWTSIIGIVRVINAKIATTFFATTLLIVIILVTATTITTLHTVRSLEEKLICEAQLAAHLQNHAVEVKKIKKHSWALVAIFLFFLLSCIPFLCVALILTSSNSNIASKNQQIAIETVSTILLTNASVNPAMYCLQMKEIRQAVWKIVKNNEQVAPL